MSTTLWYDMRDDCNIGKQGHMSALATFLREELSHQGITQVELERRTGIPDSTLSRILNGETAEPRASQIARIAKALGIKFWRLMQIAQFTTEVPDDPDDEVKRLAAAITARPALKALLDQAEQLTPEDREAVESYIRFLHHRRQKNRTDSQSAQEDQ